MIDTNIYIYVGNFLYVSFTAYIHRNNRLSDFTDQ